MTIPLSALPYATDALEPHISTSTLESHHLDHESGCVDLLNRMARDAKLSCSTLDEILPAARKMHDPKLFGIATEVRNHQFYWRSLSPHGGGKPKGTIASLIDIDHTRLTVSADENAEGPRERQVPLLAIDVWEHAYYLDYGSSRADYISRVIGHLINWDFANRNLEDASRAALY